MVRATVKLDSTKKLLSWNDGGRVSFDPSGRISVVVADTRFQLCSALNSGIQQSGSKAENHLPIGAEDIDDDFHTCRLSHGKGG